MIRFAISVAVFFGVMLFASYALASDDSYRASHPVAAPVTVSSMSGASATGGAASASISAPASPSQSVSTRTTAIGTSSAANASTCLAPMLMGLIQVEDARCAAMNDALILKALGESEAALQRLCQDSRMRKAIIDGGGKCYAE